MNVNFLGRFGTVAFRIFPSNAFLMISVTFSFGVMLYSAQGLLQDCVYACLFPLFNVEYAMYYLKLKLSSTYFYLLMIPP